MKLCSLIVTLLFCLLSSCAPSHGPSSTIIEAPDYGPIGEGVKFFALALLGSAVVFSIASMINNGKGDHD